MDSEIYLCYNFLITILQNPKGNLGYEDNKSMAKIYYLMSFI